VNARKSARKTERFHQIPIFSNLGAGEVARILAITETNTIAPGTDIFEPGAPADGFYIIDEGRVDIRMPTEKGDDVTTIATLSDRSVFGEMSFLGQRPRSAFATAVSETRLKRVQGPDFRALLDKGDVAAYKVIYNFAILISSRLRRVENELLHVLERIAPDTKEEKLAELQQFRQTLFQEWSF